MFHRPLIPVILFFIAGILIGRIEMVSPKIQAAPVFISIILVLLFAFLAPSYIKKYLFLILFLLSGVLLVSHTKTHSDLLPLARERRSVILEGTVLQPGKVSDHMVRTELRAERLFFNGNSQPLHEKIFVTVYSHGMDYAPGHRILFPATLRTFKNFNNPGRYDYERAMEQRGFTCSASVSDGRFIVPRGKGHPGFPVGLMETFRKPIRETFAKRLSSRNNALYRALILGEKQSIQPDLRESFNAAGLGHMLAVSGLHIGLIAWLFFYVCKYILSFSYRLTLTADIQKIAALMTCVPVVIYTCLAGFQISGQRAMIMVIMYLFSILLGREKETWSTLAFAALVILALDPGSLFSISFQLSFAAVIGILWLTPIIYRKIPAPFDPSGKTGVLHRLLAYFSGLVIVTASAVIFLLPFMAFYFHRISVISIPANLMAVPILGFWILPFGFLSCALFYVSPSLSNLCLDIGSCGLDWMMNVIGFWADFQWAAFWVFSPDILEIILFYGFLFSLLHIRRFPWARAGLIVILILSVMDAAYWMYITRFNPCLKVTYLDVGQGNSALVQFPGRKRMLIDGGGFSGGTFDVGGMVVAPFLFRSKILRVDYLVLSHPQSDHMNGLRFMASHFSPAEFWYNGQDVETPAFKELMDTVHAKDIKVLLPAGLSEGRDIGGVKVDLLHPPAGGHPALPYDETMDLNNHSLVIKLSYQGTSFLFPGDIEQEGESSVISNRGAALKSDVLLAPHHGSQTSCTIPFLDMVRPRVCVISSGSGNFFGFPHRETLKRLNSIGCRIIRIDKKGAVHISAKGNDLRIKSYHDP